MSALRLELDGMSVRKARGSRSPRCPKWTSRAMDSGSPDELSGVQ
jgi:hypothetical protein